MTDQKDFKTVLFEGLGLALMCWSETPKGVFDDALALKTGNEVYDAHLSDRDRFAIGFAEWIAEEKYRRLTDNRIVWWGKEWLEEKPISELLDLYKQSLTKTDKT